MKRTYEVKLYRASFPVYIEGLRYCGRFAGSEGFKTLAEAQEYAKNSVNRYQWFKGGYAHIFRSTYLGFFEGYDEKFIEEIEF